MPTCPLDRQVHIEPRALDSPAVAPGCLCDPQRLDAGDSIVNCLRRLPEIDGALRIEPELGRVAEQPRQPKGHLRTDAAPAAQQLIDGLA